MDLIWLSRSRRPAAARWARSAVPWLEWPGPHDMATLGAMVAGHAAALSPVVLVGHSTGA
jgi:hypothetical protein